MEEDKDYKEENIILDLKKSKIIVSPHEVCQVELQDVSFRMQSPLFFNNVQNNKKLDVDMNVKTFQSACEYAYTSFMPLVSRCDVWKESILHMNYNIHIASWDLGVLAHNGRFRRLDLFIVNKNESMKLSK